MAQIRILIIGGTRFVGYQLVWLLLGGGHEVTLLNRGRHPDPFGGRVERITLDRTTPAFREALRGLRFDAAVDFAAFDGRDAAQAVQVMEGRVGHYVLISSGQVYLVLEGAERPGRTPLPETAYDGTVSPIPDGSRDAEEWRYGVGKRNAENALLAAFSERGFPATRLRLPMVSGERDASGRLEGYLRRILDGGPLLLPDGGVHPVRHVYAGAVAQAIAGLLGRCETFGEAYNLAQDEMPTLREYLEHLARALGASPALVPVASEELLARGIRPEVASPFSDPWMSCIDPGKAKEHLGFSHPPLAAYLDKIAASLLARLPAPPPANYAQRARELEFLR